MPNKPLKFSKNLKFPLSISVYFLVTILFGGICFAGEKQSATVHEVLSGDSVRLKGGKILRYAGIDAPNLQNTIPLARKYGEESMAFNQALIEGKKIQIEWGPQIRDSHGNLLGYVFLEDGTFVNKEILNAGHAKMAVKPPNLKYSADLRQAELKARRKKRGLWKEEPENPFISSEYIGEKNTKIYYFPTSPELERIPEANLVKFASRVDAKAAGYRACFTCSEDEKEDI
jgi:micrococcal nuclease